MAKELAEKSTRLDGKLVVIGVTGSVAAVRSFDLAREIRRRGASVQFVASRAALEFVGEKALEFASGKKVIVELSGKSEHVQLFGKRGKADVLVVAPATANTISRIALGMDESSVTTCALAAIGAGKPVLICPAMHEPMYGHPIVQENLSKLERNGCVKIIWPFLEEGKAKLQEIEEICLEVERACTKQTLTGKKAVVLASAPAEEIDFVRVLTTRASGKTGLELAREAYRRGAQVTLLHNGSLVAESCIKQEKVSSFDEMEKKVFDELNGTDYFFCPAAVSDFSVKKSTGKISSEKKVSLELFPREKLLAKVRKKFPELFIVGFKAEADVGEKEFEKAARELLKNHGLQMVVANDVEKNAMGSEENSVLIIGGKTVRANGKKSDIARTILSEVEKLGK